MTLTIEGITISPGLAQGKLHLHRSLLESIDAPDNIAQDEVDEELSRLDVATEKIAEDLLALATRVEEEIDSRLAEVFGAHQMILGDSSLQDELRREITENLVSAGSAVKSVFLRWENRFLLRESQIARDKGDDLRDLSIRLRKALAGVAARPFDEVASGSILAAPRLLPSDAVLLAGGGASAILLEHGSIGSHASLFVREMGLPCVSGLSGLLTKAAESEWALVDADRATVTLDPRDEHRIDFRERVGDLERTRQLALQRAERPAVTRDEVTISVYANVGCREDTIRAIENGAEGIGLYRIERAYLGRVSPPNSEEILAEMRQTLSPAKARPVCVRLLDIGGDKPLSFMRFMAETNPSLGRRGIRYLREYPELLRTHLRALLQLAEEFDVRVLVPMVTLPDDVATVKDYLAELAKETQPPRLPPVGAMIETPAAALSAREIARHADFFSFGTNDLTQYVFAADRDNAAVDRYFDDGADAIFRLLEISHDDAPGVPLTACGELAGRPEHIPRLLECGIRAVSVAPPLVPIIKEAIRGASCAPRPTT